MKGRKGKGNRNRKANLKPKASSQPLRPQPEGHPQSLLQNVTLTLDVPRTVKENTLKSTMRGSKRSTAASTTVSVARITRSTPNQSTTASASAVRRDAP